MFEDRASVADRRPDRFRVGIDKLPADVWSIVVDEDVGYTGHVASAGLQRGVRREVPDQHLVRVVRHEAYIWGLASPTVCEQENDLARGDITVYFRRRCRGDEPPVPRWYYGYDGDVRLQSASVVPRQYSIVSIDNECLSGRLQGGVVPSSPDNHPPQRL